jgi:hypothetical protein
VLLTTASPTIPRPSLAADDSKPAEAARVLRWTFRRGHESILCELSLSDDHRSYELRIAPPWNPSETTTERFDDVVAAFSRHTTIERVLITEGWSLERFEPNYKRTSTP